MSCKHINMYCSVSQIWGWEERQFGMAVCVCMCDREEHINVTLVSGVHNIVETQCCTTVEPRLSGTSIIRHGNSLKKTLKMGVSAAVTMDTGMFILCADAHVHCCLSIKWVDQGVVYLIDYPVIRHGSRTKVSG